MSNKTIPREESQYLTSNDITLSKETEESLRLLARNFIERVLEEYKRPLIN